MKVRATSGNTVKSRTTPHDEDPAFFRRLVRMATALTRVVGTPPACVYLEQWLADYPSGGARLTGYVVVCWVTDKHGNKDVQLRFYAFNPYDPAVRPEAWERDTRKVLRMPKGR